MSIMSKVLMIDDGPSVLLITQRVLRKAGYMVATASNGRAAIKSHEQEPADLVIADMFMPDYDGVQLVGHFPRFFPSLPIVAVSGHSKGHTLDIASQLGVSAVLQKPFDPDDLVNAVMTALRK